MEASRDVIWRDRLETLFDAHHQRLYRLARRISRDPEEARDLVQDAFLRAARRPGSVPQPENEAEAWLVRVLINLCRDRERRAAVRRRKPPEPSLSGPDPERAAVARVTVQAAVSRLRPRQRAVIVLHELEELPVRRVAELLGLAQVTVRWHLSAGKKALARMLTRERRILEEPRHEPQETN